MDIVAHAPKQPALGQTIAGSSLAYFPGGKGANQAVAAAQMGAATHMVGRLGDDAFSDDLRSFLSDKRVDVASVKTSPGEPSGTALIIVVDGDNAIVVVPGANGQLSQDDVSDLGIEAGDVLVAQFETPSDATIAFFSQGRDQGATTLLNPAPAAPIPDQLLRLCDIVVVNESELAELSSTDAPTPENAEEVSNLVKGIRAGDGQTWIVTLGRAGLVAIPSDGASPIVVEGHAVDARDTTGAGDCFVGSLAASLADGKDIGESLVVANAAAALCVQQHGAGPSMPARDEVDAFVRSMPVD